MRLIGLFIVAVLGLTGCTSLTFGQDNASHESQPTAESTPTEEPTVATAVLAGAPAVADVIRGTDQGDNLQGSSGADRIYGRGGPDKIAGLRGSDYLVGRAGRDTIVGGRGQDAITSGRGADVLRGSQFSDHLVPENGKDRVYGGRGSDFISAATDGNLDVFRCGHGHDTVGYTRGTPKDPHDVLRGCETLLDNRLDRP